MARRLVLRMLGWYQEYRRLQPPACRYLPTCSAYTAEAVSIHGARRGLWLGARRVGRCHPWGSHGHDPVPPARDSVRTKPHHAAPSANSPRTTTLSTHA